MTATWDSLFERAAEYEVTVDEVREAVAAARGVADATDPEADG